MIKLPIDLPDDLEPSKTDPRYVSDEHVFQQRIGRAQRHISDKHVPEQINTATHVAVPRWAVTALVAAVAALAVNILMGFIGAWVM